MSLKNPGFSFGFRPSIDIPWRDWARFSHQWHFTGEQVIRRDMHQSKPEPGAGLGDIGRKNHIDMVSQVRFGFASFYTGEAGDVDNNLRLRFFKYTEEIVDRFKIYSSDLSTHERNFAVVKTQGNRVAVSRRQGPVKGKQTGATCNKNSHFITRLDRSNFSAICLDPRPYSQINQWRQ